MTLTTSQIAALKTLQHGEQPLAAFCDSAEGERLCWSGLVRIREQGRGIWATVALSERGRAVLELAA